MRSNWFLFLKYSIGEMFPVLLVSYVKVEIKTERLPHINSAGKGDVNNSQNVSCDQLVNFIE